MGASQNTIRGEGSGLLSSVVSAGASSSLKPLVTTAAITGAGIGTAVGGLIATTSKNNDYGGHTLPGSDYIGPGNEIRIDAPRSGADAIAKDHDVHYRNLIYSLRSGEITVRQFVDHIEQSDTKAIRDFAEWYDTTGDWSALIAQYGLGLKHYIEQRVGHIYPRIPGK